MSHHGTKRPICLRLVLGVLVDGGVLRSRDIVARMALGACTSRPNAERIVPVAMARLSALGMVIQHAGAAKEWEATVRGWAAWIDYADSVAQELASA